MLAGECWKREWRVYINKVGAKEGPRVNKKVGWDAVKLNVNVLLPYTSCARKITAKNGNPPSFPEVTLLEDVFSSSNMPLVEILILILICKGGSRGRVQGVCTPPEMTCGFLISTVQSASQLYKICFIIWYVFSAVHIMLLPSRKPSSSYSLLKFVYVTSQLRHSLVVHPLLRKILDPPLICPLKWNFLDIIFPLYNFDADCRIRGIMTRSFKQFQ